MKKYRIIEKIYVDLGGDLKIVYYAQKLNKFLWFKYWVFLKEFCYDIYLKKEFSSIEKAKEAIKKYDRHINFKTQIRYIYNYESICII